MATNPAKRSWVAANEKEAEAAAREDRDPDAGVKSGLTMGSVRPATVFLVTTREKAQAALDRLPEDRMETALAALEAVEGRDTSIQAILARHGEQRLDPEEFERQFGSLPSPPGRWLGSCGHGEWAE